MRRSMLRRYGLVPVTVVAALLFRLALWEVLGNRLQYLFLWPAVLFCAWYGGLGPGLLATLLSCLGAAFFLIEPRYSLVIGDPADRLGLVLFGALGAFASLLGELLNRRARGLVAGEERFRATFEQAAVGIAHVGLDGRWLRVNRRLCDILGYPPDVLMHLTFQDITHPGDLTADLEHVRQLLDAQIPTYSMEKRYRRADWHFVWVNLTVSLVRTSDGRPDYFIAVIEDISRRKELEDQVRRHAAELEHRVDERTQELREANTALEAFGYSASHDLRTPLRNLQSLARVLDEDYAGRLDPAGRDVCRRIVRAARKMDRLIVDLLAYSRLSRAELPVGSVDLNVVLAEVREELADDLADSRGELAVAGPLPVVVGNRPALVRAVTNLVANGLKFIPPGTLPRVRVWAEDRSGVARLWVEDNGIGIASEHRDRIFRVFERLHGEEAYPGTGIGLAIVKKGVERTGGRVGVDSEVGVGSRFWIELPRPAQG